MRGRREAKDTRDVANIVAWILAQLSRGEKPDEIDNAFQIRAATCCERAAEVFAGHA